MGTIEKHLGEFGAWLADGMSVIDSVWAMHISQGLKLVKHAVGVSSVFPLAVW